MDTEESKKDYKKFAYHEAGHAIVAEHYRIDWEKVTIEYDVTTSNDGSIFVEEGIELTEDEIHNRITFLMAGVISVCYIGGYDEDIAFLTIADDLRHMNKYVELLPKRNSTEDLDSSYWRSEGQKEAKRILLGNKQEVEMLVEMLLEKRTMTREEFLTARKKTKNTMLL